MNNETIQMADFTWTLKLDSVNYTLTMSECGDDSPWVSRHIATSQGQVVDFDGLVSAVIDALGMDEDDAEEWLASALVERLDFERAKNVH